MQESYTCTFPNQPEKARRGLPSGLFVSTSPFLRLLLAIVALLGFICPINAQTLGLYSITTEGKGYKQLFKFDPKIKLALSSKVPLSPVKLALSPDGSTLAISLIEEMHAKLFLIRLGNSTLKLEPLTDQSSADSAFPAFTRDGKNILFSRSNPDGGVDLYLMNTDGKNKTLFKLDASNGEYSADGSRVVFQRTVGLLRNKLFICDAADGSGEEPLTEGLNSWRPSFNPANATEIIFARVEKDKNPEIVTINTKRPGGPPRTLSTGFKGMIAAPFFGTPFTPDGQKIVFVAAEPPSRMTNLYTMTSDGSSIKRLTTAGAYTRFFEPAISPDGKVIYFLGEEVRH
jgi:Tol biopolymer transport system component